MPALMKHPVFRRLYAAHIIHIMGNEFTFIAVVGLLHDLSGSGLSFAAGTVFRQVPYVVTSLFSGALLENWDKRRVMQLVNLLRGVIVCLFFFVSNPAYLWVAFLLLILMNVCAAFFTPAMQVMIVQSVSADQRLAANSLLQGTTSFLIIVCQGAAAFLVYYFSYRFNFLFDSACYVLSLLFLLRLPAISAKAEEQAGHFWQRLREGFRYASGERKIRQLMLLQMAERVCGASYTLLMYYVLQERGEDLYVFGLLDIPLGLGGVAAGIAAGRLAARLGDSGIDRVLGTSLIASGISIWFLFHSGPFALLAVCVLCNAFASYSHLILSVTRLQKLAKPELLARVFSIREMATMGTVSASSLLFGYAGERWGSAPSSWGMAIWGAAAGLIWLAARKRDRLKQSANANMPG